MKRKRKLKRWVRITLRVLKLLFIFLIISLISFTLVIWFLIKASEYVPYNMPV